MGGQDFLYDTNVWIALAFTAHPLHSAARAEFAKTSPANRALFCRATQQSVLRLLSTAKIASYYGVPPISNHDALAVLDGFSAHAFVGYADEPLNLFARWRTFGGLPSASHKRWMDAYLAAFAMEAGLQLITCDADFKTFAGLNPLVLTEITPELKSS